MQKEPPGDEYVQLEDEKEERADTGIYAENFRRLYTNPESVIVQKSGGRYLVQYPARALLPEELDAVYSLPFTREPDGKYGGQTIPAYQMIRHSITAHRGCVSGCAFCSIGLHQGKSVVSRSEESVVREATALSLEKSFAGHITDIGGPSANMYGTVCASRTRCRRESCLYPAVCPQLKTDTRRWLRLLDTVRNLPGVRCVTLGSGIRYDLLMHDGADSLETIIRRYTGGQLKIAPEHTEEEVLKCMRKSPVYPLESFVRRFREICRRLNRKYFIVPYMMSNHPGSTQESMRALVGKTRSIFNFVPDQVQSFYPLPMTLSSVMYYTGFDPLTGEKVFVERDTAYRRRQHMLFFAEYGRKLKKTGNRRQKKVSRT